MPDATGDETAKPKLIAEAKVLRAYLHWLLVNIHAKQYDASTADTDGGIPYSDNLDVQEQKTKLTVAEVYKRILEDCSDEVIVQLPESDDNVLRADQAFGNAVRAKVLMQMKRYADALPYAQKALELNGEIEDRTLLAETFSWTLPQDIADNYVYMRGATSAAPFMETLSLETSQLFEDGDYVINYDGGWNEMYGMMFVGISAKLYFGMSAKANEYGINSDRMYYTAAECLIRTGKIREGLALVDKVRVFRVEDCPSFVEQYDEQRMTEQEAMALLQKAKWIECIGTYENFFDCKRWNTENDYRRTITRDLGEEYGTYSIAPDSKLWIFPFPSNATRYNSSLRQNY